MSEQVAWSGRSGRPDRSAVEEALEGLRSRRMDAQSELLDLVAWLRVKSHGDDGGTYGDLYLRALEMVTVDELTHPDLTEVARVRRLAVPHAESFWRSVVTRRRKKQLGVVPEKYLGINKFDDERFFNLRSGSTPRVLYRGSWEGVPRNEAPAVLKPVVSSDSLGAFYIFEDGLYSIAGSVALGDWTELEERAKADLGTANLEGREWELQEMVRYQGVPAPDLKFYCFYGEIGAVLEVSRYPVQEYAYFDGSMRPIALRRHPKSGFASSSGMTLEGSRITADEVESVRALSREIPVPFMRLDYLRSDDGLVFCEFSSAPGDSHDLVKEQDVRLGRMYLEAEIRLINDLIDGRRFWRFQTFASKDGAVGQARGQTETPAAARSAGGGSLDRGAAVVPRGENAESSAGVGLELEARGGGDVSEPDFKWFLQRGRELYAEKRLSEAELCIRESLRLRYTEWGVAALGRVLQKRGRGAELAKLAIEARKELGASWSPPPFFSRREYSDAERVSRGVPLVPPDFREGESGASQLYDSLEVGGKRRLAGTDGYRITLHRHSEVPHVLLVAFGTNNSVLTDQGFGSEVSRSRGYDYVYVAQRPQSMYQDLSLSEFARTLGPHLGRYDRVVAYGSSLGGYCALYYGGAIGAKIIASAPRNPAHPVVGQPQYQTGEYRHAQLPDVPASSLEPIVLLDPMVTIDVRFVTALVKPLYPNLVPVEVPFAGHAVLRALREAGVLSAFLAAAVEGRDLPGIAWGGPESAIWSRERGRHALALGKVDEAIPMLERSLDMSRDRATTRYLAIAYAKSGRREDLTQLLADAVQTYGDARFVPADVRAMAQARA